MSTKHYRYITNQELSSLDVMRWLRQNGTRDIDWILEHANYREITVTFKNSKLELAFIYKCKLL